MTVTMIVDTMTAMKARNRLMVATSTKKRLDATMRPIMSDGGRRPSSGSTATAASSPVQGAPQGERLDDRRDAEEQRAQTDEDHEQRHGRAGPDDEDEADDGEDDAEADHHAVALPTRGERRPCHGHAADQERESDDDGHGLDRRFGPGDQCDAGDDGDDAGDDASRPRPTTREELQDTGEQEEQPGEDRNQMHAAPDVGEHDDAEDDGN